MRTPMTDAELLEGLIEAAAAGGYSPVDEVETPLWLAEYFGPTAVRFNARSLSLLKFDVDNSTATITHITKSGSTIAHVSFPVGTEAGLAMFTAAAEVVIP